MDNHLEQNLLNYKKNTITIDELTDLSDTPSAYDQFASQVLALEQDAVLTMVKTSGRNQRTPSLAYRYRINKHKLKRSHHKTLHTYRLHFHDVINLDAYFNLDSSVWKADLPYLEKINTYIFKYGFPENKEPAPGRSFALVGDEKWLEQGGSELLHRVHLWEKMNIYPVSDPLMLAVNPRQINQPQQNHLIVENKTTYQALVPVLKDTTYATLIYGSGNKITKSIENFSDQYPIDAAHTFYYFGDIDRSGISIWYRLKERQANIVPALSFYEACLYKEAVYGKTNQRWDEKAMTDFLAFFPQSQQQSIHQLLKKGAYYPQEVLQTVELQNIFSGNDRQELEKRVE